MAKYALEISEEVIVRCMKDKKVKENWFYLNPNQMSYGVTNCSGGDISGQTNIKNIKNCQLTKNIDDWEKGVRFDGSYYSHEHYNKFTKQDIHTPHVHDPKTCGGIRKPNSWEVP